MKKILIIVSLVGLLQADVCDSLLKQSIIKDYERSYKESYIQDYQAKYVTAYATRGLFTLKLYEACLKSKRVAKLIKDLK